MKRAPFPRILLWNLRTTLRWWHILATIAIFGLLGWSSALYVLMFLSELDKNVWDAFFVSFAGPGVWSTSILEMLKWFVPHLLFFYLMGDIAEGELRFRACAIIPLIGSRRLWWLGKVVILFIFSAGYTLSGVGIVILSATTMLPWSTNPSPFLLSGPLWPVPNTLHVSILITWAILLVGSTLFTISLLQVALSIWWRNAFHAFAFVSALLVLSWLLGLETPGIVRWLPGSQSMLLRHTALDSTVSDFTLAWSMVYNLVTALFTFLVSIAYVHRLDILKHTTDIRLEEER